MNKKVDESLVGGAVLGLAMKGVLTAAHATADDDVYTDKKAFMKKWGKAFVKGSTGITLGKKQEPIRKPVRETVMNLSSTKSILAWKAKQQLKKKKKVKGGKLVSEVSIPEGTTGGNEPDSRGWTAKPAKGFSGKHTLKRGDLVTDRKTGKKYDPFKAMDRLMDRDTMPKPKVHHGSGEVINDRSKEAKKILSKEGTEINELSKSTLASYITKAAYKVRRHADAAAHTERDALSLSRTVNRTTRDRRKTQTKDWIEGNKKAINVLYANSIKHDKITRKREKGIQMAAGKLSSDEPASQTSTGKYISNRNPTDTKGMKFMKLAKESESLKDKAIRKLATRYNSPDSDGTPAKKETEKSRRAKSKSILRYHSSFNDFKESKIEEGVLKDIHTAARNHFLDKKLERGENKFNDMHKKLLSKASFYKKNSEEPGRRENSVKYQTKKAREYERGSKTWKSKEQSMADSIRQKHADGSLMGDVKGEIMRKLGRKNEGKEYNHSHQVDKLTNGFRNEDVEKKDKPYIAVHVKKGKHETHASTSYEAAKNAAAHWKLKGTAGIDVHLATEGTVNEISKELAGRYLDKTAPGSADRIETGAEILRAGERAKQQGSKLGGYDREKAAKTLANDPKYAKATQKWLNRRKGRAAADARLQGEEISKEEFEYNILIDEGVVVEVFQDELIEGREFDYSAHMSLVQGVKRKPGHYLTKYGSELSGPHPSPSHAVKAYKDLHDTSGVKIVHVKESVNDVKYEKIDRKKVPNKASERKAERAKDRAISLAKEKKGKGKGVINKEPVLDLPKVNTSQPTLQGNESDNQ